MRILQLVLIAVLSLSQTGCAEFAAIVPALVKVARAGQYVASLVDVAEGGSRAYFARHPSMEREQEIAKYIRISRLTLATLNAAAVVAKSADDGDLVKAKAEALDAYAELRERLAEFGILGAIPPEGGSETTAPAPEPFSLPTKDALEAAF